MKTIKELLEQDITDEVDVITVTVKVNPPKSYQYDSIASAVEDVGHMTAKDYEVDYDADEGTVYLDIVV
jgi:hypothetical protein